MRLLAEEAARSLREDMTTEDCGYPDMRETPARLARKPLTWLASERYDLDSAGSEPAPRWTE